jgi:trigger factor
LKSEILSQERNVVVVKSEYEAFEVDKAVSRSVRELSNKVNIKGFRRGHVPRKALEMYLGRGAIYRETLERLAQQAMEEIISEYDLDLIGTPKFDPGEIKEGAPLTVTFTFEVSPEVTLPDIGSIEAEKVIYKVEDADVDEELHRMFEAGAMLEPVDEDREATMDDAVKTQYTLYLIQDDGKAKALEYDQRSTLHISTLREDIAKSIVGHRLAEEFSFDIKLEDDYPDERIAGTTIRYEMEILQILKRIVPEETDETIEKITKGKYKTIGEIKAELRYLLERNAAVRSEASLHESALNALVEASEIDVPETMIDRQYEAMKRNYDSYVQNDPDQSLEGYLSRNNLTFTEFESSLRARAERLVRCTLVLDELMRREGINFTSDEINEEIIQMSQVSRVNPQEIADMLSKNNEEFANAANRVRVRNTLKYLVSLVKVKEIDPLAKGEEAHGGEAENIELPEEAPDGEADVTERPEEAPAQGVE